MAGMVDQPNATVSYSHGATSSAPAFQKQLCSMKHASHLPVVQKDETHYVLAADI